MAHRPTPYEGPRARALAVGGGTSGCSSPDEAALATQEPYVVGSVIRELLGVQRGRGAAGPRGIRNAGSVACGPAVQAVGAHSGALGKAGAIASRPVQAGAEGPAACQDRLQQAAVSVAAARPLDGPRTPRGGCPVAAPLQA